ncbi:hypothetical protein EDB92DRAFT_1841224 [Lactarius akahatsu]|uniref:Uncharacterized protein n=1 Tax=Lactarius akahatsu TaxID=416441 RepID=A0AAD4LKM9_9AGAM|nr:hypothetical protein EDB92DRAFT_1841224 [Lactarius akahatsu]
MLSFSKILTFAAVAFGTLSQAVPLSQRDASIEARNEGLIKGLLTDVLVKVTAEVQPILYLVPANATVVNVSPILYNVYSIINSAVGAVDKLVDEPVEVVVGVVTVEVVEGLVCNILAIVFQALAIVLKLVSDTGILQIVTLIVYISFYLVQVVVKVSGNIGDVLLVYVRGYVTIGPVAEVLSLLKIASPL